MRLPGVEPGSIAWKAIILTVGQRKLLWWNKQGFLNWSFSVKRSTITQGKDNGSRLRSFDSLDAGNVVVKQSKTKGQQHTLSHWFESILQVAESGRKPRCFKNQNQITGTRFLGLSYMSCFRFFNIIFCPQLPTSWEWRLIFFIWFWPFSYFGPSSEFWYCFCWDYDTIYGLEFSME